MSSVIQEERKHQLEIALPHIAAFREAFTLFDTHGCGHISLHKMGDCLRAWGLNPSENQLLRFGNQYIEKQKGSTDVGITFLNLLKVFRAIAKQSESYKPQDFIAGLQHLDTEGKGIISLSELHHLLTSYGEKLSEDEFSELLEYASDVTGPKTTTDPSAGAVDLTKFVRKITGSAVSINGYHCNCPDNALCQVCQVEEYLCKLGQDLNSAAGKNTLRSNFQKPTESGDFFDGLCHFDRDGSGFIYTSELKQFLDTIGERLSEDEFDILLKHVGLHGEKINYKRFVRMVMSG